MTESKRPLRIFLCHSPTDREVVHALYARLINDGMDVWLGKENLLPGQDSELVIRKAVSSADVVIVCLSMGFNQAGYRQKEVRIALNEAEMQPEGTIFIIPVRLEECEILESIKRWAWVDLFEVDAYEKLILALRVRADGVGAELRISRGSISNHVKKPIIKRLMKPTLTNKSPNRRNKGGQKKQGSSTIPKSKVKILKLPNLEIIVAIISVVVTIFFGFLSLPIAEKWLVTNPNLTSTASPTSIPTESFDLPSTPYPTKILDTDLAGNSIIMRLIPAGNFMMGSDNGENDEKPVHEVYLNPFYIDIFEVTNALYDDCVYAGACQPPKNSSSYSRNNYFENANFDNYPVVNVTWHMAISYCAWRNAQLPSEAHWEKAARGNLESRPYPWGDNTPVCEKGAKNGAKFNGNGECNSTDTEAVGSYAPNGFGLYDMAGNVWEWTNSLYRPYPYILTDGREKMELSGARVLRGGAFLNGEHFLRVSFRRGGNPDLVINLTGFRCARDVTP